jgi:hypothetical protein
VAGHLNALTPYERLLVWQESQIIWEAREGRRARRRLRAEFSGGEPDTGDEEELAVQGMYLLNLLREISPSAPVALMDLAESIRDEERFERLVGEGF